MTIGFFFWLLMVLWFIFGFYCDSCPTPVRNPWVLGGNRLLLFALFFLLGWKVFGFIIQG